MDINQTGLTIEKCALQFCLGTGVLIHYKHTEWEKYIDPTNEGDRISVFLDLENGTFQITVNDDIKGKVVELERLKEGEFVPYF